jgi:hypothetical protein
MAFPSRWLIHFRMWSRLPRRCRGKSGTGANFAFEGLLLSAGALTSVRLLTFCLMPNHWHLVLWLRRHPRHRGGLSTWPVAPPSNWVDHVNEPQTEAEMQALRQSLRKGLPFGSEAWQQTTADQFGVDLAPRRPGRPRRPPSTRDC